jgi:hypothetical protein
MLGNKVLQQFPFGYTVKGISPEMKEHAQSVLARLPVVNHNMIKRLIRLMIDISAEEQENKMDASNLAIIFAPSFLRNPTADPMVQLKNVKAESKFLEMLMQVVDVSDVHIGAPSLPISQPPMAMHQSQESLSVKPLSSSVASPAGGSFLDNRDDMKNSGGAHDQDEVEMQEALLAYPEMRVVRESNVGFVSNSLNVGNSFLTGGDSKDIDTQAPGTKGASISQSAQASGTTTPHVTPGLQIPDTKGISRKASESVVSRAYSENNLSSSPPHEEDEIMYWGKA